MHTRKHRTAKVVPLALILAALLTAGSMTSCGGPGSDLPLLDNETVTGGTNGTADPSQTEDSSGLLVTPDTAPEAVTVEEAVTGGDTPTVKADTTVILTGDGASVEGAGVRVEGSVVTFTAAGTYFVTGQLTDGQLVVDTEDKEKVKLVLNGVSVSCSTGPAVYVKNSPKKTILYTEEGSINLLSDGSGYIVDDADQIEGEVYPNACVYACDDLKLDGAGTLQITGNADKGINTKDDLEIVGGTLIVQSVGTAVRGNDSVEMTGGSVTLTVTGEGDGLKSAQTEKDGKGYITISGGSLYITAIGDGISAATDLTVSGGSHVITTLDAGGKALSEATSSGNHMGRIGGDFGGGMMGGMMGGMNDGNSNKSSISAKGLKAEGTITFSGGKLTVTAVDDGIHANDTILLQNGEAYIRSGDDGVHADRYLVLSGGSYEIAQSYEGLEAAQITVSGGQTRITASDDGMNASNGSGGGMMGGIGGNMGGGDRPGGMGGNFGGGQKPGGNMGGDQKPGGDMGGETPPDLPEGETALAPDGGMMGGIDGFIDNGGSETEILEPLLTISGGYTIVNAAGDGIDSNGNIVMTGGTLLVFGPTDNGNGAIDYGDGNYSMTISGGTLLAVGSSGMAETADGDGQAVFACSFRSTISAGTLIGIKDADGKLICGYRLPKSISSVVFSSPALVVGDSYTLVQGGSAEADADGVIDLTTWTGYSDVGSLAAK